MLDGEHVLARAALAAVLREPRARAARDAVLDADDVVGVAARARVAPRRREAHGALLDELARAEQARMHLLEHGAVVRELAVEVRALREVVADAARGAERAERRLYARPLDARSRATTSSTSIAGSPCSVSATVLHDVLVGGGEVGQHAALAREAAEELGREREDEPRAVELELPRARLGAAARARAAARTTRSDLRERQQLLEQPQPLRAGEADRRVVGARREPQAACPRASPTRPRATSSAAGSAGTAAPRPPAARAAATMCALATCTSAKPFSQRSGSGTFFSTAEPASVSTRTSSWPTCISIASSSCTRASAARIGGLKSTFVVPHSRGRPSSTPGSRSSRAYTPAQAEKDSKRSRSRFDVTTGSAAAMRAATMFGGS